MHAASIILLSWGMIGAACFFSSGSAGVTAGILAALGEFPAETFGKVGPHGAASEAQVAIGGKGRFRPGAIEAE